MKHVSTSDKLQPVEKLTFFKKIVLYVPYRLLEMLKCIKPKYIYKLYLESIEKKKKLLF